MNEITLDYIAFSELKLRVIKQFYDNNIGDILEVICPNNYDDNNDGFIIRNILSGDYCQIVLELTDDYISIMKEYEFPILKFEEFFTYFNIIKG